jgi:hypothetical protein
MMNVYHYGSDDALAGQCPFNDDFTHDAWVAFHGTSNHAEVQIESQGIAWQPDSYAESTILAALNIFDQLHWSGREPGGFGVLASFAQADFEKSNHFGRKPIFLAETSFQSVLYASRAFAGGETARALRLALGDLREYLDNPVFRKKAITESWKHLRNSTPLSVPSYCVPQEIENVSFDHIQQLWGYFESFGSRPGVGGRHGVKPCAYSDVWLRTKLAELETVHHCCDKFFSSYLYGVVYAIRFTESDLPQLGCDRAGLTFDATVSPERILAKSIISPDVGYPDAVFLKANEAKVEILLGGTGLGAKIR